MNYLTLSGTVALSACIVMAFMCGAGLACWGYGDDIARRGGTPIYDQPYILREAFLHGLAGFVLWVVGLALMLIGAK